MNDIADALVRWLDAHLGPDHGRRVTHMHGDRIVISKVEPGLASRVLDAVDRLPELFDTEALVRQVVAEGEAPADAWRSAVTRVLERALQAGAISRGELREVMAGVDSVAALLASCLWTFDGSSKWTPDGSERIALDEVERHLAGGASSLFTRHYGVYDGRRVESHCPGAQVARRLFGVARQFVERRSFGLEDACPGGSPPVR